MKRITLLLVLSALLVTASFGQGALVEYKLTSDKVSGTIKTYYLNGNTRSETNIQIPGMPGGNTDISIAKKDVPDTLYRLNEKDKTYSTIGIKPKTIGDDNYEITVLGKEKIGIYNTNHIKVLNTKTKKETEIWSSKDVVDYGFFKDVKNKYLDGSKLYEALVAKGVDGYPVKMVTTEPRIGKIQLDLIKAEKQNVDASLFSLDGYTRGTASSGMQDMREKIKNMSPEERQQFIQQMKQSNQQPH